ncbi:UvrD-helicase domain-containing protein [Evansella sp. AB-rgal1]|uniref:UvrD-helicase domain-containing protein n=1 Tax=Evansella sp. AB-rgal1 TaxID=3242696 RepID=UPI00359F08F0
MTKLVVDQDARDQIKDYLNQNFLVEAGAGSGKTTSLVERMVQLIHTGTCKINEIVAITFTRKAADELKTRFQNQLEKTWKSETNKTVKMRLEEAIQNMEQCFLGTVHSFCSRLLRERPIEAKLDITFQELEEEDDKKVAEEAWYSYVSMLQEEYGEMLQVIRDIGLKEATLLDRFHFLKNYPDVEWVWTPSEMPDIERSYDAFLALLKEANRCIPVKIENGPDNLQKAIKDALRMDAYLKRNNTMMIEVFDLFDKKSAFNITQNRWTSKEDAKEYKERIQLFFEDRIQHLLLEWREYCHPIIIEFLQGALHIYEQIKKQRSLLNFQDLLINTSNLLKYNPEVRTYFQQKYRCLLVDEFQDTDPIQAEMMFFLTGEDVSEVDWGKCKPRAGSLFVVGDPKQAIYRFRRADIDIYNKVKELIVEHGGSVLQLTMNFRTVDTVTTNLNSIFIDHLPETETKYQAAYRPLHSFKDDSVTTFSGISKLTIPKEYTKNQGVILEKDAENILHAIQTLLHQGHEPKEFMIITRYNDGIDVYAHTLEEAGIPISVSGEMEIGSTQEFKELPIILQVFVDPTDTVTTVAALRSMWFGISDEQLFQWKQAGGTFSIYSPTPEKLELEAHPVSLAFMKLRMYAKWALSYPPVVAMEKIIEDIGFYPLLLIKQYGKREYTQFLQIIEALRNEEDEGRTLYEDAVSYLTNMMETKSKVVNLEEDANAVRILNVHKAKGLEAPIVFLANPGKKPDISDKISSHIKREENGSKGFFKFDKKVGYASKTIAQPKNWEEYRAEEERYLTNEDIRILYVAATRAEEALIISCCSGKDGKNPWEPLLTGLSEVEEFFMEEVEGESPESSVQTISKEMYDVETKNLTTWVEISSKPSYSKMSPTDEKPEIFTLGIERETGGGMAWGLAVHEVFEKYIRNEISSNSIRNVLQKHELSIEREEEVHVLLERFVETEIWDELQRAEEVLTEVPFSIPVTEGDPLYYFVKHKGTSTVFISGVIDLVYKVDGEWKIVDYKTDRPKDLSVLPELANYYQDQVEMYKSVWSLVTGETVSCAQLYFVTPNQTVVF